MAIIDASVSGKCLNNQTGFLYSEILNIIMDLALVCPPIPIIAKLRLPLRERVGLGIIFMLGGLYVFDASCVRVKALSKFSNKYT